MSAMPLIAIVEDDDSLRPAIGALVRSLGYRSEEYASAEAFLCSTAPTRAACLVSDFQLPGLSGIDLAAQLQGVPPIILITARTERALDALARENGVLCLLRKPFEADELTACIGSALDSTACGADKTDRDHPN